MKRLITALIAGALAACVGGADWNPVYQLKPDDAQRLKEAGVEVKCRVSQNDAGQKEYHFTVTAHVPKKPASAWLSAWHSIRRDEQVVTDKSWQSDNGKCVARFVAQEETLPDSRFQLQRLYTNQNGAVSALGGYWLQLAAFAKDKQFASEATRLRPGNRAADGEVDETTDSDTPDCSDEDNATPSQDKNAGGNSAADKPGTLVAAAGDDAPGKTLRFPKDRLIGDIRINDADADVLNEKQLPNAEIVSDFEATNQPQEEQTDEDDVSDAQVPADHKTNQTDFPQVQILTADVDRSYLNGKPRNTYVLTGKSKLHVKKATFVSAGGTYQVHLKTDEYPPEMGKKLLVKIGDKIFLPISYGGTSKVYFSLTLENLDRESAEILRGGPFAQPPQDDLAVVFIPRRPSYAKDGSIDVDIKITNLSDKQLSYYWGTVGDGRIRCRDKQLSFTATLDGDPVPAAQNPLPDGFIQKPFDAVPKSSLNRGVDLTEWLQFKKPGRYTVKVTYLLDILNPHPDSSPSSWTVEYQDTFTIQIEN